MRDGGASNLALRVATAAVGVPAVLLVDYLGRWTFALAAAAVAMIATMEFYQLMRGAGYRPFILAGLASTTVIVGLPIFVQRPQTAWIAILVGLLGVAGAFYLAPERYRSGLLNWSMTLLPVVYVGLLLGHLAWLRQDHRGAWWVFAALVITWASDTGAYAAGVGYGRRPFMAHLSARKTREGALGGLLLATLAGLLAVPTVQLAVWQGLLLGCLVGVAAQTGDLVESMIKRQLRVKDSGTLLPGHGGLLDRIDSLLFTAPLVAYVALLLGYAS
jgi:phosphatidate cytidylyltransferase